MSQIPSDTDVVTLFRSRGSPGVCHLISDNVELDGKEMSLGDAIAETELGMLRTLVGCIPGKLAYYYGECGEQRLLLERTA